MVKVVHLLIRKGWIRKIQNTEQNITIRVRITYLPIIHSWLIPNGKLCGISGRADAKDRRCKRSARTNQERKGTATSTSTTVAATQLQDSTSVTRGGMTRKNKSAALSKHD